MSIALAPPRGNAAGVFVSTGQIARRVLLKFIRSPQLVVVGTVQGAMFLLIFRYVFGGAIVVKGVNYVDFVVPGFITTGVLFNAMYASAGMAEDMSAGLIARLRSLPIPRSAVLVGRAVADTGLQIWGLAVTVGIGFLVGFRLHGSWGAALAAAALVILFGFVFEWVFVLIGMLAGSAQAAQGFALIVFPFTFVSSAYIPVATMPSWMRGFAENQPITVMVNAVRCLTQGHSAEALLGHPTSYFVIRSLIWSVGIVAVFAPLAVAKYRRG
jgi:ABC-2 type transport system permease protein